jgi:RimJ/RimL family protein N-acetyltransferase
MPGIQVAEPPDERSASNVRMDVLETERLRLEPWTPAHGELLARMSAMPEVMRHIGGGDVWTAKQAEEHSQRAHAHWRTHGFGWRAAFEREGGRAVGTFALELTTGVPGLDDGEHEIGWWLDPAVWRRGYATEGGRAIVREAFGRVGASSVVARVQPENAASLAVAAALGLRPERDVTGSHGEPVRILRLRNPPEPARSIAAADRTRGG